MSSPSRPAAVNQRRLHVLVLSQHFWPETFRINEVAESLRDAGCEVSALTGQPNYPDGAVFPGYRALAWGAQQHPAGYMVYRVPLVPRGRGGALKLVLNYLSFVVFGSLLGPWLLRKRRIDVVFVYGTSPILQAIVGIVLKRTHRARLVTWVQDLWPQSLEVTGYVRHPRALAAVGAVVRWIYRHNDLLLVQSPAFRDSVRAMAPRTPVEVQPNPGERAFDDPAAAAPAALLLPPGVNVVFAGNLGHAQALDTVVQAARLLKHHAGVRIVLVGSGARAAWLVDVVRNEGLDNVLLTGRFPPEQMPGILAQASALLVSLAKSPIMELTIPSKLQAYLAAGKPIIASVDGEGARVVREAGAGLACAAEDAQALADAVLSLCQMTADQREAMGRAGRAYYDQHFQPAALAEQLRARFAALAVENAA